jgi:hypothetical protein
MAKTFQEKPNHQFGQVKDESVNSTITGILDEWNGNLGSNNLPIGSLVAANFKDGVGAVGFSLSRKATWTGQGQNYHRVKRWNVAEAGLNVWDVVESIDLGNSNWGKGWNPLENYGTFSENYLDFDAKEGMIIGCAVIDFFHGYNRVVYQDGNDNTFRVFVGQEWWTQWGVFVNDTLVAETSETFPRRETINLPFKVPVGSQKLKIDLRWKSITADAIGTNYQGNPSTPLEIYGAEIWVRNVYR